MELDKETKLTQPITDEETSEASGGVVHGKRSKAPLWKCKNCGRSSDQGGACTYCGAMKVKGRDPFL